MTTLTAREYDDETFEDADFTGATLDGIRFHECSFRRCNFSEATLARCRFSDCDFTDCNLSLTRLTGSLFDAVHFTDCKMVGINWTQAHWPRVRLAKALAFHRCVLNDSSFFGLDLRECELVECRARDVDFTDANCEQADFSSTDLFESVFARTRLAGANFIDAQNYRIDIFTNDIKRARFSLPEAVALLDSLDIELQD
ncbi:pentapeptide repeat-containing protein [Dyella telluris]|uniref:Pentapeptide repeat-containing protein n=1 Tax=Dyella telluris TaxID=2763498 RepID=A0A7G8PZ88_9GAMM|nr:pentapeptide repeat-containing protein [Dyella telluris]QNJ99845.1 pentapeptide repeat-containing protein [Dyella telluris]